MGIRYENLDKTTREYMIHESSLGGHYISPRLTEGGKADWQRLIEQAIREHNDDWLAGELLSLGHLIEQEPYVRGGIERWRKVNGPHAAQQLAEGEFNRYYLRGLCQRGLAEGRRQLVVYRGKEVESPRPESEAKIGTQIDVEELLVVLRSNDFVSLESAIGVPSGPNSGLSARLP